MFSFMAVPAQKKSKNYDQIMKSTSIYEIDAFLRDAHDHDPRRNILRKRLIELISTYIKRAHPADQNVVKLQVMLATIKKKPSTKISFAEMNEIIRQKQIKKYQEEVAELQNPTKKQIAGNKDAQSDYSAGSYGEAVRRTYTQGTASGAISASAAASSIAAFAMMSEEEQQEYELLVNTTSVEHKVKTVQILNKLFENDPSSKDCIVMIQNNSDCNMIVRIEGVGNTKYRLAVAAKSENSIVILKGSYLFSSLVCGAQYASQKTVQKAIMVALDSPK